MLAQTTIHGHKALWLQNDLLRVVVLPEKGADIYEFIYQPAGIQFLMKTPQGLRPPGAKPPADFLENYEGAWQELFPNHNEACVVNGRDIPFHGEVATRLWDYEILREDEEETALRFSVRVKCLPFRLERVVRLRKGEAVLEIEETVVNESDEPQPFVWGQHITLGGDFLEQDCQFDLNAKTLYTPEVNYEPEVARLEQAQQATWPLARSCKSGEWLDLSHIPGPQARSHDDAFITGFESGHYAVKNPRLGLAFTLDWDARMFPWVVLWQPYGGPIAPPLTGIYGVGVEPWVSRFPLAGAIQHGQARVLPAGEKLLTRLRAGVEVNQ